MARTGLYKSEVKKARDSLLAQQKHPSVDAVRIALGNTGSKTTIHKYLKELETEDGGADGRKASISNALQDLVERLAAGLHAEANIRSDTLRAEYAAAELRHTEMLTEMKQQIAQLQEHLQATELVFQQEHAAHGATQEDLHKETVARHMAEQQVADFKERLTENESHRLSLEDKHRHAREALDHYRQSVKEQRDQDQRRHEQQVQHMQAEIRQLQQSLIVKQEDVTRLNQEGVRLVSELSHARQTVHEAQESAREIARQVRSLQAVEQRNGELAASLAETKAQLVKTQEQISQSNTHLEEMKGRMRGLEIELAQATATSKAYELVTTQLQDLLASHGSRPAN